MYTSRNSTVILTSQIFAVLYKSLQSANAELAETSFECMKSFIDGFKIDMDMVHQGRRGTRSETFCRC